MFGYLILISIEFEQEQIHTHYSCCYVINKRANNLQSNGCQYLNLFLKNNSF